MDKRCLFFENYKPKRLQTGLKPESDLWFCTLVEKPTGLFERSDARRASPNKTPWDKKGWYLPVGYRGGEHKRFYIGLFPQVFVDEGVYFELGIYWCYHDELDDWFPMKIDRKSAQHKAFWFNDELYTPKYFVSIPAHSVGHVDLAGIIMDVIHE